MNLLKRIPVHYKGELHDVRLINFSVALDEVKQHVPAGIKIREFGDRAMISMVDVKLKKMRPVFLPASLNFNYRHVAFRLLVDDSGYNDGTKKGIYFLRSFSENSLIVTGGGWLTDYNLETAEIHESGDEVVISQGDNQVKYSLNDAVSSVDDGLREIIGALDRAYSVTDDEIRVTEIQREKWPIQPVSCYRFENTFFRTARLEGAFRVNETIYYDWLPPKVIA